MDSFTVDEEEWASYCERLDQHFIANGIGESAAHAPKRKAILISCMGKETYRILKNLCEPAVPATLDYEELIIKLQDYFAPTPSVIAERHAFHRRTQDGGESVAQFAAELRKLTRHCKYGSFLDSALRDQFVVGLTNTQTVQALFMEPEDLTFDRALKLALSHETAVANMATHVTRSGRSVFAGTQTREAATADNGAVDVHRVRVRQQSRNDAAGKEVPFVRQRTDARSGDGRAAQGDKKCQCCGKTNHTSNACRFKDYKCHVCNMVGHLRPMCPNRAKAATTSRAVYQNYVLADENEAGSEEENLPIF